MAHARSTLEVQGAQPSKGTSFPPPAFHVVEGPASLTVTTVMRNLELTYANATGGALCRPTFKDPRLYKYAFCDVSIQGASLLNYAFLSLLSYFDNDSADFRDGWTVRDEDCWGMAVDEAAGGL